MSAVAENDLAFTDILGIVRGRASLIFAAALMGFVLAATMIVVLPPTFKATASILLDPRGPGVLRSAEGEFSSRPVDAMKVASVAAVIQSDELLEKVVKAQKLTDDPEFLPQPGWFRRLLQSLQGAPARVDLASARLDAATEALRLATRVTRDGFTYVIKVDVLSHDAAKAQVLAQAVSDAYVGARTSEARIISPPKMPDGASFPKPVPFLLGGLALGLLAGALIALALEFASKSFSTPREIERALGLPVLASLPLLTEEDLLNGGRRINVPTYVALSPFSRFSEGVRSIRAGLRQHEANAQVVQFTSPMPGEGKSTLAASVAVSAAQAGVRTLLIDCDCRHRSVSMAFKAASRIGVAEVLAGSSTLDEVILETLFPRLSIIPAGHALSAPMDFVRLEGARALINAAAAKFDLVIVDSAALEVASDASRLAEIVDQTVIVIKWRSSDRRLVQAAIGSIERGHGRLAGVALNAIDLNAATKFGHWTTNYMRQSSRYYHNSVA